MWFEDPQARRLIALRYVPWLAALNLAWETAQLPLYTIWTQASSADVAFAVLHCTAGDVLIGTAGLVLGLVLGRERELKSWRWARIVVYLVVIGVGYTIVSEWLNTSLSRWTYSERMPTLPLPGSAVGLSPLLQWLLVPPFAVYLARRT